ncbi:relaxin-3 receptor 2-like [Takifugu rubripes]|uniref:relaxin-3 receptor 2-like n=1 Tax=Takifugu rubripes TaxID=31033 RepID=UPI0011455C43|nr:relaxin-3 receptor 2-like [Takifugu rubripes]
MLDSLCCNNMSDAFRTLPHFYHFPTDCNASIPCNTSHLVFSGFNWSFSSMDGELEFVDDGLLWMRVVVSVVYSIVATAGVLVNVLVMFLLYSTHTITTGTINFFVFNLALAHLLFSMVLVFWAIEIALDYSWPFSLSVCKAVCFLTGLNVYASCFFLAAMSLTRYCYVATALKSSRSLCSRPCTSQVVTAFIWAAAVIAASPRGVFAELAHLGSGNDTACVLRFPNGTAWLGINQLLRMVLGFLLPYAIITLSYLLLLRFLCRHNLRGSSSRRKANVSRSVAVVVLSFCVCWFPYNILSFWSSLIQLDMVQFSLSFFWAQTYFFPVANCLAFTSSCFNPVIYCLVRKEYRAALRNLLLKLYRTSMSMTPRGIRSEVAPEDASQLAIPLHSVYTMTSQSDIRRHAPLAALPTVMSTVSGPDSVHI